ncbi:hypothetical protein B296_00058636 [Ensete ventricosum]|uniref:Uncharacterized protein n=1 Tax=Ensete ventricosum TaxID=4639 RepID=A0A426XL77_ENSVE|nr:hypothetical protein B296_00058636 [Ensete ventricosum]
MERELATLEKGAICCAWNYCGLRLAVGFVDGSISIHDSLDSGSSSSAFPSSSSKWKVRVSSSPPSLINRSNVAMPLPASAMMEPFPCGRRLAKVRNLLVADDVFEKLHLKVKCLSLYYSLLSPLYSILSDTEHPTWKLCKLFESSGSRVLDLQFGVFSTSLKMVCCGLLKVGHFFCFGGSWDLGHLVAACSDGYVKVYELLDPLEFNKWQLQVFDLFCIL